jgi:pimeloyl-ACP methyl ester carboxylesterase
LTGGRTTSRRLDAVEEAFRGLPARYLGAPDGFDATFHVRLADVGHTWEVRLTTHGARVRKGVTKREPDVTIGTDADTWLRLRDGEVNGIDAFSARKLYTRGNLDLAVAFEGFFRRPNGRDPLLRLSDVPVGRTRISTLSMGEGHDVLLLHGLGATKASFLDTASHLSRRYRVHVLDLPGFGSSSKPATAPYNAKWFGKTVLGVMDELGIEQAHLVGNSMGGRVALELGISHPERVTALGLLCPAVAFVKREFKHLVRVLRPEFGLLPHKFKRDTVARQFWSLFADPDLVDPSVADVAMDEFQRIYGSAGARYAFLASARNIYLEAPFGKRGFYPRLAELEAPALFVWSSHDRLIPAGFERHVTEWLPRAEQIVLDTCGHAPQIERPEQTNGLLSRFFAQVDALGGSASRRTYAAAA